MSLYLCPRWRNKIDLFIYFYLYPASGVPRAVRASACVAGPVQEGAGLHEADSSRQIPGNICSREDNEGWFSVARHLWQVRPHWLLLQTIISKLRTIDYSLINYFYYSCFVIDALLSCFRRLVISQHGRALHIVAQHQFLDSPEWFGVSSDEFFQVRASLQTFNIERLPSCWWPILLRRFTCNLTYIYT